MEIEPAFRISFDHFAAKLVGFVRIENAQRVGQHDAVDVEFQQFGNHKMNVIRRITHAIRPVFEVNIHPDPQVSSVINRSFDVFNMLFRTFAKLLRNMFV